MIIPGRKDKWEFRFPKTFVDPEVEEKFAPYFASKPNVINTVRDFISHSIQSITIPSISQEPAVQQSFGRDTGYRSSFNENNLFPKEVTVTFLMSEGFLNYFMMYDVFFRKYDHDNTTKYIDPIQLYILNSKGVRIAYIEYHQVLFKGLTELDLDYTKDDVQPMTFTATFAFNKIHFELIQQDNIFGGNVDTLKLMNKVNPDIQFDVSTKDDYTIINTQESTTELNTKIDSQLWNVKVGFEIDGSVISLPSFEEMNNTIDSEFVSVLSDYDVTIKKDSTYGNIILKTNKEIKLVYTIKSSVGGTYTKELNIK